MLVRMGGGHFAIKWKSHFTKSLTRWLYGSRILYDGVSAAWVRRCSSIA